MVKAVSALKNFEKENAGVVAQEKSYRANLEKLEQSQKQLADMQLTLKEADQKLVIAARSLELSGKEEEAAIKAAKQQYKDDVKNAEKIQKQKDEQAKK